MIGLNPRLLGIDLGTSSVKVTAVSATGVVLASTKARYGHTDDGVRFEQDAEQLWQALVDAVQQLGSKLPLKDVAAVGLVGQCPSLIWVDSAGKPLLPMMGWRDVRAAGHVGRVSELTPESWQLRRLRYHLPVAPGFTPVRLSWFAAERPDIVEQACAILSIKDFAVLRLTGEVVTDAISARGLCDGLTGEVAVDLLDALGIDKALVPPVRPPWTTAGHLLPAVADATGLPSRIPVTVGWGDLFGSMLAIKALGGLDRDFDITGTAEAGGSTFATHRAVPGLVSMPVPDGPYATYGSTQAGGGSVAWLQHKIFVEIDESWIDQQVSKRRARPPTALFLPHLGGERAPLWDAELRGTFLGLDASHDRVDLTRAVLEGVAFSIRQILQRVENVRGYRSAGPVVVAGAAASNNAWNQIKADVLGRQVEICRIAEPSAVGAALLASVTAGDANSAFEAAESLSRPGTIIDPNMRHINVYNELYAMYDTAQEQLSSLHKGLAAVRVMGRDAQ